MVRDLLERFLAERRWSQLCAAVSLIAFCYTLTAAAFGHDQFTRGGVLAVVGTALVWMVPRLVATVAVVVLAHLDRRR